MTHEHVVIRDEKGIYLRMGRCLNGALRNNMSKTSAPAQEKPQEKKKKKALKHAEVVQRTRERQVESSKWFF